MALATRMLLGCVLVVLAGCGNSRAPSPNLSRPAAPQGFSTLTLPEAGVRLEVPSNWTIVRPPAPLVLTVNSGTAVVALWRFVRPGPPPTTAEELAGARTALIAAIRRRDRALRLLGASFTRVAGVPAIEIDAVQRVRGRARRVSSTHIYGRGIELVLDTYAPPAQFGPVAGAVFSPVRRSMTLIKAGRV